MRVYARVRPGRAKLWVMDYSINGTRTRRVLHGVKSKTEAQERADRIWSAICRRVDLGEDIRPASRTAPLLSLSELLVEDAKRVGIKDATRRMAGKTQKPLLRIFGDCTVSAITEADVEAYKRQRHQKEGVSARTVNIELSLLGASIRRAKRLGTIDGAWDIRITKLSEDVNHREALSPAEFQRLQEECDRRGFGDMVRLQANLALRLGELMGLRWGDVDLDRRLVYFWGEKRGGSSMRIRTPVPANDEAVAALRRMAKAKGYTDTPPTGELVVPPVGHGFLTVRLKTAAKHAGIRWARKIRPHDLRHYAATAMLQNGVSIVDTARMLRHRNATVTLKVYAHAMDSGVKTAADILGRLGAQSAPNHGSRVAKQRAKK